MMSLLQHATVSIIALAIAMMVFGNQSKQQCLPVK
jgi:hypothetical protein